MRVGADIVHALVRVWELRSTRSMNHDHGAWGMGHIWNFAGGVGGDSFTLGFCFLHFQILLLMVIVIVMIIIAEMSIIIFPSLPSFLPLFPLRSRTPLPLAGRSTISRVLYVGVVLTSLGKRTMQG